MSDFTVGNSNDLNDSTLEEEGGVGGGNDDDQHNASTDAVASDPGTSLLSYPRLLCNTQRIRLLSGEVIGSNLALQCVIIKDV